MASLLPSWFLCEELVTLGEWPACGGSDVAGVSVEPGRSPGKARTDSLDKGFRADLCPRSTAAAELADTDFARDTRTLKHSFTVSQKFKFDWTSWASWATPPQHLQRFDAFHCLLLPPRRRSSSSSALGCNCFTGFSLLDSVLPEVCALGIFVQLFR